MSDILPNDSLFFRSLTFWSHSANDNWGNSFHYYFVNLSITEHLCSHISFENILIGNGFELFYLYNGIKDKEWTTIVLIFGMRLHHTHFIKFFIWNRYVSHFLLFIITWFLVLIFWMSSFKIIFQLNVKFLRKYNQSNGAITGQ